MTASRRLGAATVAPMVQEDGRTPEGNAPHPTKSAGRVCAAPFAGAPHPRRYAVPDTEGPGEVAVWELLLDVSVVDDPAWWWVPAATAASLVALWNLWRTRWWRKLVAVIAIPLYALAAAVGINAAYGLNPTIGSVLHISTADEVDLPDLPDPGD